MTNSSTSPKSLCNRVLLLLVLAVSISGCTITNQYGPYYGKVVDAETKEPLEGAAVLVVFYTASATVGGAVYHYADAEETVTDKNGEFKIPANRIIKTGILQRWDNYGHVTIFKPGYGCYPEHQDVKPMFVPNGTMPENYNVTFELPVLRTREERLDMPSLNFSIPYKKQNRLIELINQEMENLGSTGKYSKESFGQTLP